MRAKFLTLAASLVVLGALAQSRDGQMQLRVVDSQTGQPLAGVKVRAWAGSGLVTDESGNCSFPLPQAGAGRFFYRIALSRQGYVPKYITWSQSQNDKVQDIPAQYTTGMDQGVTVGGIVKNENGEPVPGARVIFSGPPPAANGQRERTAVAPNYCSERADADGRWQNSEVPKDFRALTFRVTHPDYVPAVFGCEGAEDADPAVVQWPESNFLSGTSVMLLTHGIELSGVVLDSSGRPAPETTITRNHEWRNPAATLTTGEDGRFKIANLRPGEMILTFQAMGRAAQTRQLTLSNGMPELRIEMKPGNLFQGRVVDETGKPIAGARAQLDRLDLGPLEYDWSAVADEQGRFLWDSAPDGGHPYYFSASGYRPRAEPDLTADGRDKIISLRRAKEGDKTIIDGHVTDVGSKAPITKFSVYLKEFKGGMVAHSQRTVSATNGHYSVEVDPASIGCMIEIAAAGYAPEMSDRRSCRDGDQRLDFALEKGEGMSGTVYLADGKPAAGAEVAVCSEEEGATLGHGHFNDRFQRTIVAADDNGEFLVPQTAGAQSICAVGEAGFAETNIDGVKGPFRITLASWGTVEGVATAGGKLLQGEEIALLRNSGQPGVSVNREDYRLKTEVDGAFVFSNVPPGNVALFRVVSNRYVAPQFLDVKAGQMTSAANLDFDLGEADVPLKKALKPGDIAPPFEIKTVDGQALRLSDFRGKYVLLDFWATWCGPCVGETPHLKAAYDAFGGGGHFVMIGLSLDNTVSAPASYARKNNIKWVQGFLGSWSNSSVTPLYGVDAIPSIFLIDPEGRIIERDLRGDAIGAAVGKALGNR
jgi:peroxiredoxin/5-hydroxyisourate hydrolase-like protein (transthyretin family)